MDDKHQIHNHIKGRADEKIRWLPITHTALEVISLAKELNPNSEYVFIKGGKKILLPLLSTGVLKSIVKNWN